MKFNYRKVSKTELVIAVLFLFLTLSSAVSADTFNEYNNHYSSYEGPKESFFENIFDSLDDNITGLINKVPELLFQFILKIFNQPIELLINGIIDLISEPIPTDIFYSMWKIIVFTLSFFFTIILVLSGFNLMLSAHDLEKREKAKQWLTNTIILIIIIPLSYVIYSWILEIAASLGSLVLNHVNYNLFFIGDTIFESIFLELFFTIPYTLTILLTLLLLLIRFAIVSSGIMLFPVALMLYFIPPTRDYGKLILNFLLVNIFSTFFIAIIILTFSLISNTGFMPYLSILTAMAAFMLINIFLAYVMFFAALKAAFNASKKVIGAVKLAKFFI